MQAGDEQEAMNREQWELTDREKLMFMCDGAGLSYQDHEDGSVVILTETAAVTFAFRADGNLIGVATSPKEESDE
jgi:hypothetical protein